MTSLIVAQATLLGLLSNPNHGNEYCIAGVATASTMANKRAIPARKDHDVSGSIHVESDAGTDAFSDASSANHPNRDTKPLMISGPIVPGSRRMPIFPRASSMRSPSLKKRKAPR